MKKYILLWIFNNRHRIDKGLSKKIIIGLATVFTIAALIIGLLTYAGYKTVQYAFNQISSEQKVSVMNSEIENKISQTIQGFQLQNCTTALQQRLDLNTWLNRPLSENYHELLQACFQQTSQDQPKTTKEIKNDQSHI